MIRLRKWIADRLDGLADWAESRSRDLNNLAWRIRPRTKMVGTFNSELIAATLRNRTAWLAENVTQNNALLKALKARSNG